MGILQFSDAEFEKQLAQEILLSHSADDLHKGELGELLSKKARRIVAEVMKEEGPFSDREIVVSEAFKRSSVYPRQDSKFLAGTDFLNERIKQGRVQLTR